MMAKKAPADDAVAPIILFSALLQLKKKVYFVSNPVVPKSTMTIMHFFVVVLQN